MRPTPLDATSSFCRKAFSRAGLAAVYLLGASLGLAFSLPGTNSSPIWPSSGIAFAGLLLLGWRGWPGAWLGAFLANLFFSRAHFAAGWPLAAGSAALIACGNTAEAVTAWWLWDRWLRPRWINADGTPNVQKASAFRFGALAWLAAAVGACVGTACSCASGLASWGRSTEMLLNWAVGDATGILITAPLILSYFFDELPVGDVAGVWEAPTAFLSVCLLTGASFGEWVHVSGRRMPLSFFVALPLIWMALRLGPRAVVRAIAAVAVISAACTIERLGMFAFAGSHSLLLLDMFLWGQALAAMALAFEVAARHDAQAALARLNAKLEDAVQSRTEHLRSALATIENNERRFAAFMGHLPGIAFMKDAEGRYLYMSDKVGELFGVPAERWLGATDFDFFPVDTAAKLRAEDRGVLETGDSFSEIQTIVQPDGKRHWLTTKFAIPGREPGKEVLGAIAIDANDQVVAEEALAARMRQQTAVAQLGLRALRGGEPHSLLRGSIAQIAATLGIDRCGVFELLPDDDQLVLRAAHGWPEGSEGSVALPFNESSEPGYAALHREALAVADYSEEKRFRPAVACQDAPAVSGASVVIFGLAERPYGVLCAHSSTRRAFSDDDIAFLQASANVLAMAIQRQALENEVQEIGDNERSRIAYDLHDGLGQELAGVSYMASVLASSLAKAGSEQSEDAAKVASLLRDSVRHTRAIVRGLCPVKIEDGGLPAALGELARSTQELTGIDCRFEHDELARVDDPFVAGHLFRIAQECVHNAVKHSGASRIAAKLVARERNVELVVEDDGVGLEAKRRPGGLGLRIMRHRAGIINASISFHSRTEGGTRIVCQTSLN